MNELLHRDIFKKDIGTYPATKNSRNKLQIYLYFFYINKLQIHMEHREKNHNT